MCYESSPLIITVRAIRGRLHCKSESKIRKHSSSQSHGFMQSLPYPNPCSTLQKPKWMSLTPCLFRCICSQRVSGIKEDLSGRTSVEVENLLLHRVIPHRRE